MQLYTLLGTCKVLKVEFYAGQNLREVTEFAWKNPPLPARLYLAGMAAGQETMFNP
jgi:hypothetical protein